MFMCIIISLSCFVNYKLRFLLQFTRTLLRSGSVLARKSERRRVRRERHFMNKKSCKAAESIEDALLRMARVNSNKIHYSSLVLFAYKIDGNRKRCKWLADSSNDRVVS